MSVDLERSLRAYAELLIRIGLDLQPGQRLLITEPYDNQGVSLESAPLVRVITEVAYKHGARFVDVIWADSALHGIRQVHAPRDSFAEFSDWKAKAIHMAAERGDALLFLLSSEPGSQDPKAAHNAQVVRRTAWQHFGPTAELLTRGSTNWCAAPVASTPWAAIVFADAPESERLGLLWKSIFDACRLDQ
ncbi:MAG TPA: aminopeptidase, partial [Opitutaceae bacterium]|nr:aminopeptidase [Opitutaceae bacterium]